MAIEFNERQKKLIETVNGPILCVACPGSGKTTTMIARIIHMLELGADPARILPVTFTNAAKNDMTKRFNEMAPEHHKNKVKFRTIHGISFSICMTLGYTVDDVIQDAEGLKWLVNLIRNNETFHKGLLVTNVHDAAKTIMSEISFVRNSEMDPVEYSSDVFSNKENFGIIFNEYIKFKKELNKLDWDDMIILARDTLRDNLQFRNKWQDYTDYIMVDEFQDTNKIQYDIIGYLAGKHRNLCIVGDDDQSIYAFRGAKSSLMLHFPVDYPECIRIDMDTNYRSKKGIIDIARNLIERNKTRFLKEFKGFCQGNAQIHAYNLPDSGIEARYVVSEIEKAIKSGIPDVEIGVLYRTSAQSAALAGLLMKKGIPFHTNDKPIDIHEDLAFKDIMAWYRICKKCELSGDVKKILMRPNRYFSSAVFKDVEKFDRDRLMKIATEIDESRLRKNQKAYYVRNLQELFMDVDRLSKLTENPAAFVAVLFERIGYIDSVIKSAEIYNHDPDEWMFILEEIEKEANEQNSFEEWIQYVNEYREELILNYKQKNDGVTLSTFHSSKGLEWDKVFILDCNEGICPYNKAKTEADLEEERRAFYVAITRSKTYLDMYVTDKKRGRHVEHSPYFEEMKILDKFQSPSYLPM